MRTRECSIAPSRRGRRIVTAIATQPPPVPTTAPGAKPAEPPPPHPGARPQPYPPPPPAYQPR